MLWRSVQIRGGAKIPQHRLCLYPTVPVSPGVEPEPKHAHCLLASDDLELQVVATHVGWSPTSEG